METWLWVSVGAMAVIIILLILKIHALRKSAREIERAFAEKLAAETNTLIDISSGDRCMRSLARSINSELAKLRKQRHRFVHGNKELKDAVTNISHDLRTPLTAICGYLDLLESEEKTDTVEKYLNIIRNRAEMLTQLTDELFRYSVILSNESEMKPEQLSLGSVLEESAASFYAALTEREISPKIRIPEQKVIRYADRSALMRIFSNLINNAVKYSDGDLEIELKESGEIIFANTASGLDEIRVGRLFDRFYTVEAARNSTGLGLSIAKTLTEIIGGSISAEYTAGRLTVRVFIPNQH